MNEFFEQELRKLFGDGAIIDNPTYSGRSCFGTLGKDLRVRIQFVTTGVADHYNALKVAVLNRTEGPVDTMILWLKDLLGKKQVPGNPNFSNGIYPYIWNYNGDVDWYAYHPTFADYQKMQEAVGNYLEVFRERETAREPARDSGGPKLVYICAPLRGDVEKNIEFARQKALEVFQEGCIPVCPHLMFPPITDPENPELDQTMREMGLRLVASCQEVRVFGPEWTDGMWAEIRHAMKLDIDVMTDQKTIGRTPPPRQAARKGPTRKGKGER